MLSIKTLVFNNNESWVKKDAEENFDVLMGCYEDSEICELVGVYILNKFKKYYKQKEHSFFSLVYM